MTLLDDRRAEIEEILSFNADIRALERAGRRPLALYAEECQEGLGCGRPVYKCTEPMFLGRIHVYRHADGSYECGDGDNPPDPEKVREAVVAIVDATRNFTFREIHQDLTLYGQAKIHTLEEK